MCPVNKGDEKKKREVNKEEEESVEPRGDPEMAPLYLKRLLPVFAQTFQQTMLPSIRYINYILYTHFILYTLYILYTHYIYILYKLYTLYSIHTIYIFYTNYIHYTRYTVYTLYTLYSTHYIYSIPVLVITALEYNGVTNGVTFFSNE